MKSLPIQTRFLVLALAGWLNRHQQDAVEYLREENRVLREMLGKKRLAFTDRQRRRLAIRGQALGRALLAGIATLVSPDTLFAWHRKLVAKKWSFPTGRHGNAAEMNAIAERFVKSVKDECLRQMIFFGPASLDRALREYSTHFLEERNHQGIGNVLIAPTESTGHRDGRVARRERLGGLLSFFHRNRAA